MRTRDAARVEPGTHKTKLNPAEPEIAFIQEKVNRLLQSLDRSFVERQTHIRVALLAFFSGHHELLLGPPGTAKSLSPGRSALASTRRPSSSTSSRNSPTPTRSSDR